MSDTTTNKIVSKLIGITELIQLYPDIENVKYILRNNIVYRHVQLDKFPTYTGKDPNKYVIISKELYVNKAGYLAIWPCETITIEEITKAVSDITIVDFYKKVFVPTLLQDADRQEIGKDCDICKCNNTGKVNYVENSTELAELNKKISEMNVIIYTLAKYISDKNIVKDDENIILSLLAEYNTEENDDDEDTGLVDLDLVNIIKPLTKHRIISLHTINVKIIKACEYSDPDASDVIYEWEAISEDEQGYEKHSDEIVYNLSKINYNILMFVLDIQNILTVSDMTTLIELLKK